MNNIINFFIKDPILTIAGIISAASLILIFILSYLYKKIKDEQRISEIVSTVESQTPPKLKKKSESSPVEVQPVKTTQQKVTYQDFDLIVAQLSELSSQVNNLNKHVQEISKIISTLKETQPAGTAEGLSENTIVKLVDTIEKLVIEINSLRAIGATAEIKEINNKLDNLLKLLSTILQQE